MARTTPSANVSPTNVRLSSTVARLTWSFVRGPWLSVWPRQERSSLSADARDADASARDVAAVDREMALDKDDVANQEAAYGNRWPERREAGRNRG